MADATDDLKPKPGSKIKVDLSEWIVDSWADDLVGAVKTEVDVNLYETEITITLQHGEAYDRAVRKIGQDAIAAFFEGGDGDLEAILHPDGVHVRSGEINAGKTEIVLPWQPYGGGGRFTGPFLDVSSREMLDDLVGWLQQLCNDRGLPWPPPVQYPDEGYATVPWSPERAVLEALYEDQPSECVLSEAQALAAWQKALRIASEVFGVDQKADPA